MKILDSRHQAILTALRTVRGRQGVSQAALGARVGLPQSHIAGVEHGIDARLSTLLNIASGLGLELMLVPRALEPAVRALIDGVADRNRTAGIATEDDPLSPYLVPDEHGHEQGKGDDAIRS